MTAYTRRDDGRFPSSASTSPPRPWHPMPPAGPAGRMGSTLDGHPADARPGRAPAPSRTAGPQGRGTGSHVASIKGSRAGGNARDRRTHEHKARKITRQPEGHRDQLAGTRRAHRTVKKDG